MKEASIRKAPFSRTEFQKSPKMAFRIELLLFRVLGTFNDSDFLLLCHVHLAKTEKMLKQMSLSYHPD